MKVFNRLPKSDQKALAALVRKWGRMLISRAALEAEPKPVGRPRKQIRELPGSLADSIDLVADDISGQGCRATHHMLTFDRSKRALVRIPGCKSDAAACKTPRECSLRLAAAFEGVEMSTMRRRYYEDRRSAASPGLKE